MTLYSRDGEHKTDERSKRRARSETGSACDRPGLIAALRDWSESVCEILSSAMDIDLSKLGLDEAVQALKSRSGDPSFAECSTVREEADRLVQGFDTSRED